jgi:hypothetical protein
MLAAVSIMLLAACGAQGAPGGGSGGSGGGGSGGSGGMEPNNGCFVHLYDDDNFSTADDNFVLTQPGSYTNLDNLPGANQSWTDEADSFKVGSAATVTVYDEENFEGNSKTYQPGSEEPSADIEPSSLKMSCSGNSGGGSGG